MPSIRLANNTSPNHCVHGQGFTVDHALICPTGGFPRHNELRAINARLLSEVCPNVRLLSEVCPNTTTEPVLQPLSSKCSSTSLEDEARLDVTSGVIEIRDQRTFIDVRGFHPNAKSYYHQFYFILYFILIV